MRCDRLADTKAVYKRLQVVLYEVHAKYNRTWGLVMLTCSNCSTHIMHTRPQTRWWTANSQLVWEQDSSYAPQGQKCLCRHGKIILKTLFVSSWMSRRIPCMYPARVSVLRARKSLLGPPLSLLRYTSQELQKVCGITTACSHLL